MKSKLLVTFLLFVLCNFKSDAQLTFQKTYGGGAIDYVNWVQQTFDEGFIMTGTTSSIGAGSGDVYLVKTNLAGDTTWTRSYGGSMDDIGYAVEQTSDSGYIVVATTNSFGAGLHDVYLIKTNSTGDTLWTKTFGGQDQDYGYGIAQTFDGGFIVSGIKNNLTSFDNDVWLIKTDANGDTVWTKTYGGSNHDESYAVQQTSDSGYILAGHRILGAGSADVYVIKTNASGDTLWTNEYGGPDVDYGFDIEQTSDGGFVIGGYSSLGAGVWDALMIKINSTGGILWSKTYGGVSVDYAQSFRQTSDGGYIIGGSTNNFGAGNYDMYMIKTDSLGDTLWTKTYGGTSEDRGYYAIETNDGGFMIAGYTVSFATVSLDMYLVKTDANGNTDCNLGTTAMVVGTPALHKDNTLTTVAFSAMVETHPTTVIYSGGSESLLLCAGTGTNELNRQHGVTTFYPNPASQQITIELKQNNERVNVTVVDVFGKIVLKQSFKEKTILNTGDLKDGLYFLRVSDANKIISTGKMAVQH